MFLHFNHHPVFIYEHRLLETGFYLRLQVKLTQLGPIDTATPYLRTPAPIQGKVY
jgi:hypothetical protein